MAVSERRVRTLTAHLASTDAVGPLTTSNMNPHVKAAQYAVRGELVIKAGEYADALARGEKLPFSNIIFCNIGNPHSVGQHPLTFHRQVLSLCLYPELIERDTGFPEDVRQRAKQLLEGTGGYGLGSQP